MTLEPVEYRAIRNLQTALQAIDKRDGYHYTVDSVAVKLDPDQNVEDLIAPEGARPVVIVEVNPDVWSYVEMPNGILITLPTRLHVVLDTDPTVDEDFVRAYFRGCADAERAIALDTTRGGYAEDTRILQRAYDKLGAQVWAKVDVAIDVRRTYGEPDV